MSRRFREWVEAYQDQAWTLARYLLRDASEAEDVCQEAFVKLWHHRDAIDPDKVRPWLMKVTRNGCLDRMRRHHPSEEFSEEVAQESLSGRLPEGPFQDAHRHELGQWLSRCIEGLTEPYRSLVVLRDIHQHSYEEVAGVLELSLPQVKVYLHRARKQLREQLAEVKP